MKSYWLHLVRCKFASKRDGRKVHGHCFATMELVNSTDKDIYYHERGKNKFLHNAKLRVIDIEPIKDPETFFSYHYCDDPETLPKPPFQVIEAKAPYNRYFSARGHSDLAYPQYITEGTVLPDENNKNIQRCKQYPWWPTLGYDVWVNDETDREELIRDAKFATNLEYCDNHSCYGLYAPRLSLRNDESIIRKKNK